MTKFDIRRTITRYINQEATQEELSMLYEWVKKGNNQEVFKKYVQADFLINYQNRSWKSEEAFKNFLETIKENDSKKVRSLLVRGDMWKYAAAIVVIVSTSFFALLYSTPQEDMTPRVDLNMITLQLENGEVLNLDPSANGTIKSKMGNTVFSLVEGVLIQKNGTKGKKVEKNNVLKIPYGKKLSVTLQDGTVVMLNSGSTLSYPASFSGKDKREVYLQGEAFFEVAKNPEQPFFVKTNTIYTQVYGTVFNVSAYTEDGVAEVVLVEGSVGVGEVDVNTSKTPQMLKPSQKASKLLDVESGFVVEDVDVSSYVSWTKGILTFENEAMSNIIKKLERQYNIHIINQFEELGERRFTGMFDVEDIDRVLKTIQTHTRFSYQKEGKTITIKEPNKQ
ncbi:DUF4974 domain-containing protein [Flagellimonas alvinocaridis]|uniref:DUF4974 domain-containing protein n=1 Tax=Flagellimonas alvinocaridis TaxID=2530200 RepID=A0A4S8RLV9_9FLAO|nr:FecR domain-containing protein [Allomuricauda alvinocaridis]THV59478.1 DUF4974 domain-containing protein [Allomuricauda alvinocaridis]